MQQALGRTHLRVSLRSDGTCRIWNVFSQREVISLELQGAQLQEMKWDYTGSLLCTGTKNREYQLWDPRTVNIVCNWIVSTCALE